MKGIINSFIRGLFKNTTRKQQPEGTIRFALNAVNETSEGDQNSVSNEESNEECFKLPIGYVPLGKVYIGDNEVAILSTNGTRSEIGIADDNCNYTTHVNGLLDFKITNQIDVTYRLRRGCNKTIYWVDGDNNPPMNYDFSNPEAYKTGNVWDKKKFSIESTFSVYPKFTSVEVDDGGGSLASGSYNIGIQYVDESLNATPIITTTATINIYGSSTSDEYTNIQGSINSTVPYDFPLTSKSIKVEVTVDTSFKYYRLAFIEFNSGDGTLTSVKYSNNISTNNTIFVYTGDNYATEGSIEDIMMGGKELSSGDSIEQIDNRLVIANTTGQTGNLCEMQRFVSEITADLIIKEVVANSVVSGNTKSPTNHFEAVGYMPGEIYSFGFVCIFDDNSESPVYHIPGKNHAHGASHIFSPGTNVYPMSIVNSSTNDTYLGNGMCDSGDYWGKDSNGDDLEGTKTRHHRFPYRDIINVPMIEKTNSSSTTLHTTNVILVASGTLQTECTQEQIDNGDCSVLANTPPQFLVRVTLTVNGNTVTYLISIDPADYSDTPGEDANFNLIDVSDDYHSNSVIVTKIEEQKNNGTWEDMTSGGTSSHGLEYETSLKQNTSSKTKSDFKANVYGIKFSNINLTAMNAISDKKIIGYHIVRNERKETDKTILDSAIMTPCVNSDTYARKYWGENDNDKGMFHPIPNVRDEGQVNFNFMSNGLLSPVFDRGQIPTTYSDGNLDIGDYSHFLSNNYRISKKYFGIINPEYKFNHIKYENVSRIRHTGTFNVVNRRYNSFMYLDVNDETTYDPDNFHKSGKKFIDKDGMAFRGGIRDSTLDFSIDTTNFNYNSSDINNISYLSALDKKSYSALSEGLNNLSADNRTGIIELKSDDILFTDKFPYVYLEKDIANPYTSFRTLPYYKVNNNIETSATVQIFDGDTYITPMRYFSSLFIGNQAATRPLKTSVWKIIVGVVVIVGGAVLAYFTGGSGLALIPVGVALITSGASEEKIKNTYGTEYGKGLSECLLDGDTFCGFKYYPSQDDEVQWFGEVLTDLWFESKVNISLRNDVYNDSKKYFLDAPGTSQGQTTYLDYIDVKDLKWPGNRIQLLGKKNKYANYKASVHLVDKLLSDAPGGKKYNGYPPGEIFEINPDFDRMNKQKVFFHLGIEYDCCSSCQEAFPHRIWYSEQSFQEELSDNYKIFLPNNYRDITGETGRITDLFKMKNNLYIHTEEALWHLPASHQEKVIDQIVSYIGTGEFFSIPPMIILDDEQSSGGSSHKWATIKTDDGVFFISERERKPYYFDGKNLRAIPGGLGKWFEKNIKLQIVEDYTNIGLTFPNPNNPSNVEGAGFIATHDPQKDRVIFTKRDQSLRILAKDHLCYDEDQGGQRIIEDYQVYIDNYALDGWEFEGFVDCTMVFSKREEPDNVFVPSTVELKPENLLDNSWTISYSPKLSMQVKDAVWLSWHSYLPRMYLKNKDKFYSWITERSFWKHGKLGEYQNFYGKHYPFIIEFISAEKDLKTKIWDHLELFTEASKYDNTFQEFKDDRFTTFNKAIFYNSRQSSGVLNLMVKDLKTPSEDYLLQQVQNISGDTIIIDRDEKNWHINDIRDYVINQDHPLFTKNIEDLQTEYFIDKEVNIISIDHNKDWYDLESFRDKYLSIRLIFDNFDDVKLLLTHSISYTTDSER